jgi:hypothetical protein
VTIEGASQLHQALYTAIEAKDAETLNSLIQQYFADIMTEFGSWTTVPVSIRADQNAECCIAVHPVTLGHRTGVRGSRGASID